MLISSFCKIENKSNIMVVLVIRNCKTHLLAPNYSNLPHAPKSPQGSNDTSLPGNVL